MVQTCIYMAWRYSRNTSIVTVYKAPKPGQEIRLIFTHKLLVLLTSHNLLPNIDLYCLPQWCPHSASKNWVSSKGFTMAWKDTVLDTDHRWISDKSVLLCHPLPVPKVRSYFHHISNIPPFVPVPLVSPFVPLFPVSLISVSMPLWSSRLLYSFLPPIPVFPCFMLVPLVPSPWPSQANPAA